MTADNKSVIVYKPPKNTLEAIIKGGTVKGNSSWWHLLSQGFHAGFLLGLACGLTIIIAGALDVSITGKSVAAGVTSTVTYTAKCPTGLKKLLAAAVFPLGLIVIVFCGAELFTSNVMYMLCAKMANKTTWKGLAKNWFITYFGNLCGSLFVAYFLFHLTKIYEADSYVKYMNTYSTVKCDTYTWGETFLKGWGANYLVCLAIWGANASEDISGKIFAIWWPLFGFVAIGFEHSIANMFYVPLAIMDQATDITASQFITRNLIPVTIGNIFGALMLSFTQYITYHPDQDEEKPEEMSSIEYYVKSAVYALGFGHVYAGLRTKDTLKATTHDIEMVQSEERKSSV